MNDELNKLPNEDVVTLPTEETAVETDCASLPTETAVEEPVAEETETIE
jgi:hypothetical protein